LFYTLNKLLKVNEIRILSPLLLKYIKASLVW